MPESFQDKTEPATPRRRSEARERGQVAQSPELYAASGLTASVLALVAAGPGVLDGLEGTVEALLARLPAPPELPAAWLLLLREVAGRALRAAGPFLVFAALGGAAAYLVQTRGVLSMKVLGFRPERLNPLPGLKNLFGLSGFQRLGIAVLKITALVAVVLWTLLPRMDQMRSLAGQDLPAILGVLARLLLLLLWRVALVALLIGLLDFAWQRWKTERDLKMTPEQAKEERMRTEGNPAVRVRVLERQRQLARERFLAEVPRATAVVVNPSHIAVALRYVPKETPAPVVVAKGRGRVAERILEIATRHGVPVVRREALAQALHRLVAVGREVPPKLYHAVAEVLAHVLRTRVRR